MNRYLQADLQADLDAGLSPDLGDDCLAAAPLTRRTTKQGSPHKLELSKPDDLHARDLAQRERWRRALPLTSARTEKPGLRRTASANRTLRAAAARRQAHAKSQVLEVPRIHRRLTSARPGFSRERVGLAVEPGVVMGVLVPDQWLPATVENFPGFVPMPRLRCFVGRDAPPKVARLYLRHKLPAEWQRAWGAA